MARRKAEREKALQSAKDAVAEIDATGVQVKDLDIGLLDFPCIVGDDVILLCWKLGEKGIKHWHGTQEGFAGRKPIDDRICGIRRRATSCDGPSLEQDQWPMPRPTILSSRSGL